MEPSLTPYPLMLFLACRRQILLGVLLFLTGVLYVFAQVTFFASAVNFFLLKLKTKKKGNEKVLGI